MPGTQYKNFCFTSFDLKLEDKIEREAFKYLIMQQETCPDTGRVHWQGYAELKGRRTLSSIKIVLGDNAAHIEKRRGTAAEAAAYCKKIDTAIPGTQVEFGEISKQGYRSDLLDMYGMLREGKRDEEILETMPATFMRYRRAALDTREVLLKPKSAWRVVNTTVHYGATGTGKTRSVYEMHPFETIFCLDNPNSGQLWFDGYEGQSVLLIDDFYGWVKHSYLLRLLDGYPLRLPIKGSHTWACWTTVYITSNKHPSQWYKQGLSGALCRRIGLVLRYDRLGELPDAEELVPIYADVGDE